MIYSNVLEHTTHIPIGDMDNKEWLEKRRSFIGGSDVGAVMGISHYGSPLTVYLEKKGLAHVDENEAMRRGSIMEPYIRQLTQKSFPCLRIEEAPCIFQNKEHPFMGANVDGFILVDEKAMEDDIEFRSIALNKINSIRGIGVHEIKTSQDGYGFGENEVPDSYFAQVQHYLSVTDLAWALLSVYIISKNKIRHYVILRNAAFINNMIGQEKDFVEKYLNPSIMPAAMGLDSEEDMVTGMFDGGQSTLVLGDVEKRLCASYVELSASIKKLEERKKAIANDLKATLVSKSHGGKEMKISAIAGGFNLSWLRYEMARVDTEALKKAGLYDQYSKRIETGKFTIKAAS